MRNRLSVEELKKSLAYLHLKMKGLGLSSFSRQSVMSSPSLLTGDNFVLILFSDERLRVRFGVTDETLHLLILISEVSSY